MKVDKMYDKWMTADENISGATASCIDDDDDDDDARIDLIDSVRASVTPSSSPPTISQATRYTTIPLLPCSPLPVLEVNFLGVCIG